MDNIDNIKIGMLLKKAREAKKISQSEMCEPTGLTKNHISYIERGKGKATVKMLLGYCNKLNLTPNDILGYTENNIISKLTDRQQLLLTQFIEEIVQQ